jgi:16S rRNA (guanine1207-N2)-methyltransferase
MNNHFDLLYFKKEIPFRYKNQQLLFRVSQDLFSSQIIDYGTQRLLRTLNNEQVHFNKLLDVGCGYGVIGISLKKTNPSAIVHMIDKDMLE